MDHGFLAIALLALAAALIVAEIFVPSGGLLAVSMILSLIGAIYFAWLAWWPSNSTYFYGFVGSAVVVLPGFAIGALAVLPYTSFGKSIFLPGPAEQDVIPFAKEEARLNEYVGEYATAITPLNPGGMVSIDRERLHAYSEGMGVEAGATVEILRANGTRVQVREVSPEEQQARADAELAAQEAESSAFEQPAQTQTAADDSIDFELPDPTETDRV